MDINQKIAQLRKEQGLTIYRLSQLTGISQQYLGKLERGEFEPTYTRVCEILRALGYSVKIEAGE